MGSRLTISGFGSMQKELKSPLMSLTRNLLGAGCLIQALFPNSWIPQSLGCLKLVLLPKVQSYQSLGETIFIYIKIFVANWRLHVDANLVALQICQSGFWEKAAEGWLLLDWIDVCLLENLFEWWNELIWNWNFVRILLSQCVSFELNYTRITDFLVG